MNENNNISDINESNNMQYISYSESFPSAIKNTNFKNNEKEYGKNFNNSLFKNSNIKQGYRINKIDEEKEEDNKNNEDEGFSPRKKRANKELSKKQFQYKIVINKPEEINFNKKISNNIVQKIESNNDINLDMEVNNEIYPGEIFELKLFDDEKPKKSTDNKNIILNNMNINNKTEKVSESVYINNFNIIGKNYIGINIEDQKKLEEKIKLLELELQKIKKFNKLEISSSVSTLEINSSYENINEISDNTYIIDAELRESTKQYIKNRNIILHKSLINTSLNFSNNFLGFQKIQDSNFEKISSEKRNNEHLNINNINKNTKNLFKSIIPNSSNQTNKVETFLNKIKNSNKSSINCKHVRHDSIEIRPNYDDSNFFYDKKKSYTIEDEKKKKRYQQTYLNKNLNNIVKKKKKKNELDIISLNIQKGSQNLNQPDVFYAGLFSQLMFKGSNYGNDSKNFKYKSSNNN